MSIISLTKGIITLSTASGAALGGYFASGSFGNVSENSEDQSKEGDHGDVKTQDSSDTLESEDSKHSDGLSIKEQEDLKSKASSKEGEKTSRGIQVEKQNYVPLNSGTNDLSRFSREEEGWLEQGAN
ncbi:hypothetical protein MSUIS_02010 [Mycoplasma suis KI3806]|nr:hypothetical protein [Mycoplasma suis]CBZ40294.1 hypothetical protein MSUIS_02010 [Mycoplasma suis KI3806]